MLFFTLGAHKHTLTQVSLQLIQTELLRDSQQLIGTVSVSSFASFSHSGRKEELSQNLQLPQFTQEKKPARYLSLFASPRLYPSNPHLRAFTLPGSEMQFIRRLSLAPFTPCVSYLDSVWIFLDRLHLHLAFRCISNVTVKMIQSAYCY